ncbi:MAG TPA: phospholipase D-like domain-containing protein [Puia sp.]|nr:phospholipase D-like domain-containing protein [Puia sp.]
MDVFKSKSGVSVRAHKGDAMTLLAMDLDKSKTKDFTGFSIFVIPPILGSKGFFLFNRISYSLEVQKKNNIDPKANVTMDTAPLQKFRWVHTPNTNHNINQFIYGKYIYQVTPRYLVDNVLQPLDPTLTVSVAIDVSPYKSGDFQIGFTRGFIESQAFTRHFGLNNATRPNKTDLIFDITQKAGPLAADKKKFPQLQDYTYEDVHKWLGWQARVVVMDFLEEAKKPNNTLDVFAFDLDEPLICDTLIKFGAASAGKVRIILDDSKDHTKTGALEAVFDEQYRQKAKDPNTLVRGHFASLAHSKVFILKTAGRPVKVLTGSTNFSTNGIYINANHVLVFNNPKVAAAYEQAFERSFSVALMKVFSSTDCAINPFEFNIKKTPVTTIRFSPHTKEVATGFFDEISKRILAARSDVLFAIMKDNSASSILSAVLKQVKSSKIFTYGITDVIGEKTEIMLYKPNSRRGVRIAGKPGAFILPPPFTAEAKIPGISVHHKFVVVDFKGADPTVYCGSSNLAFGPEQKNGDNLITIRDKDAVTAFAIEAIRLVDHFHFFNQLSLEGQQTGKTTLFLHDSSEAQWFTPYYDSKDLLFVERTLLIK